MESFSDFEKIIDSGSKPLFYRRMSNVRKKEKRNTALKGAKAKVNNNCSELNILKSFFESLNLKQWKFANTTTDVTLCFLLELEDIGYLSNKDEGLHFFRVISFVMFRSKAKGATFFN